MSLLTLLGVLMSGLGLSAAELGDPAKPLDVKEWVKGTPVDIAAGKSTNIYVVEFWATWCPPCRASIPHLTELQKKFRDKDVVFVGVTQERSEVVKNFVEKMGEKMDYTVAIDAGKTSEDYMDAFGITGIPHAFIVDKSGNMVWHGHPMDRLEETLQQMVDGKFNPAQAKKRAEAETKLKEYLELTLSGEDAEKAKKLEGELVALEKELGGIMDGEKFDPEDIKKQIKFSQTFIKYQELTMNRGDTNEIARLEKEMVTLAPKDFDLAQAKDRIQQEMVNNEDSRKAQALLDAYVPAVGSKEDPAKAAEFATKLEGFQTRSGEILNEIAWTLLTDDSIKTRDTKLALKIAKRGVDVSQSKNAGILDTYARALFEDGQIAEAIEQQKKAIALAMDPDMRGELAKTLQEYEAKAKAQAKPEPK